MTASTSPSLGMRLRTPTHAASGSQSLACPRSLAPRTSLKRQGPRGSFQHPQLIRTHGRSISGSLDGSYSSLSSVDDAFVSSEIMDIEQLKQIEEAEPDKKALNVFLAIAAALLFGLGIWGVQGPNKAAEYFAGYLLEQSLSIDNLFVFVLVFEYFKTPRKAQDVVLTYGIASAAVLRLVLIGAGSSIIGRFKPLLVVFAAILMVSSFKLLTRGDGEGDDEGNNLSNNAIVKFLRPRMTLSTNYDGTNFFTVENGVKMATPLLLVLLVVELTDVVFAVDSIPAVFGVTLDPFIIYTSNIFAILSLRSVYAFVATILGELKYLDKAIAAVLGFIGCKILAEFAGLEISTAASLLVVVGLLGVGVLTSLGGGCGDDGA
uniref:Thylakoid membrane protein TERC, chloroplastic n=1 Tax=Auxenochlorella protothecoides TaxID=3075 RepID=A0A1D2ABY5_AUXPR